jgi:hypothetical protein
MEKENNKEKNSQAPDYLELIKVLTEMGYIVDKFENITPEQKDDFTTSCPVYELRLIHCV